MYRPFFCNIIYDGVDLGCYFDINNVSISPFPEISLNTVIIPGKAGSTYFSKDLGERTIKLNMSVKADDRNSLSVYKAWRELTKLLIKDEPKAMQFDEGKSIYVIASETSDIDRLGSRGVAEITFTAPDPYFYGRTLETTVKPGANTIWVNGEVDTWPIIELTGAANGLTVTNTDTSEKIVIPSGITSTSRVVIEPERTRCTVNGEYVAIDLNLTDYFSLPPGQARLNISSGTGTLRYRERFL